MDDDILELLRRLLAAGVEFVIADELEAIRAQLAKEPQSAS